MTAPSARPILAASGFSAFLASFYTVAGIAPPPIVALGIPLVPFLTSAWWIQQDARAAKVSLVHDWGLMAWVAWPLLIPWYAWKTRGWNGWRLSLGLFAAMLGPYLIAFTLGILAFIFARPSP